MTPTPSKYKQYIPLLQYESAYSTMASPVPEFKQPIVATPPKLSLCSLPSKPHTLPDGLTPPPNMVAAVPFLWEEAPGKPRPTTTAVDHPPKSKAVRSLDLPPRLTATTMSPANNGNNHCDKLVNTGGIEIIPSPTTVLGGPYEGVYPSKTLLGSPEKVVVNNSNSKSKGKIRMPLRKLMRKEKSPVKFSSWRWGSFRDMDGGRVDRSPPMKSCSWRWDSFRDIGGGGGGNGGGGGGSLGSSFNDLHKSFDSGGKIGKVKRRYSFTFGKGTSPAFLASMYGTLKQALPWKSRK